MIMKFKNGKVEKALPNGLGDNTAYFDGTTSAEIMELDTLPINGETMEIKCSFNLEEYMPVGEYQAIFSYGKITSSTRSSVTICVGWDEDRNQCSLFVVYNNNTPINTREKVEKGVWNSLRFGFHYSADNKSTIVLTLNGRGVGSHIEVLNVSGKYINVKTIELSIGKQNTINSPKCVNFKGNIKNFKIEGYRSADVRLQLPLHAGQDDETLFKSKSFVYDTATYETSSGFNSLGKPIRYRSASQAGVAYSAYPVPNGALLSNCDSLTDNVLNFTNCEVSTDIKKFGKGSIKINSDGYIKFEHDLNLLNTSWTVGHFFYLENYATGDDWKPLINNDDDVVGTFLIGISSSGYIKWHVRGYSSANITQLTSGWHHLRVTHIENDKLRVYLDGVFITEFSGFSRANNTMWIGDFGYVSSYQFNGYIDNIEFFEIPSDKLANYSGDTAPVPSDKFSGV